MQYGSIFGHGAYLGPDYTADYLHRAALLVREHYGGEASDRARARTITDFKTNRLDAASGTLQFSAAQAAAHGEMQKHYGAFFSEPTTRYGLRPNAISDPNQIRQLTAFFAWTAWAASALRPELHLRAMNMLYEGMKDKGSLIIVPSSALETMNLGVMNYAAMKTQTDAPKPTNNGQNGQG